MAGEGHALEGGGSAEVPFPNGCLAPEPGAQEDIFMAAGENTQLSNRHPDEVNSFVVGESEPTDELAGKTRRVAT